jgi:hypothetical protein
MESIESSNPKIEEIRMLRLRMKELGDEAQNAPSEAQRETVMQNAMKLKRQIEILEREAGL